MGKRWSRKNKNRGGKKDNNGKKTNSRGRQWKDPGEFQGWVYSSPAFEAYYKAQEIVPPEEWDSFMKVLQEPLPACFRVNLDCPFKEKLREELHSFAKQIETEEGMSIDAITKLEWYPYDDCYQLGCDRRLIRKSKDLTGLKEWLMAHTNGGHITRQEAVSMVPPCFLDVQPHHKVLDMCASPGSKTCQILELLHRSSPQSISDEKRQASEIFFIIKADDSSMIYTTVKNSSM